MSDLRLEEEVASRTISIDADALCHIDDQGVGAQALCGRPTPEGLTCPPYDGEAVCPGCGRVTCPKCVELCSLRDRLEDD